MRIRLAKSRIVGYCALSLSGLAEGSLLEYKKIEHSMVATTRSVYGVFIEGEDIVTIGDHSPYFGLTKYHEKETNPEKVFGRGLNDTALTRHRDLNNGLGRVQWRGATKGFDNRIFFLDARGIRIISYDLEKKGMLPVGDLIIDLIRPAKDTRGEPPPLEVREYRKDFLYRYQKARSSVLPLSGLVKLPDTWRERENSHRGGIGH